VTHSIEAARHKIVRVLRRFPRVGQGQLEKTDRCRCPQLVGRYAMANCTDDLGRAIEVLYTRWADPIKRTLSDLVFHPRQKLPMFAASRSRPTYRERPRSPAVGGSHTGRNARGNRRGIRPVRPAKKHRRGAGGSDSWSALQNEQNSFRMACAATGSVPRRASQGTAKNGEHVGAVAQIVAAIK